MKGCDGDIYSIAVLDHKSIIAGGENKIINYFDLSEGRIISKYQPLYDKIRDMALITDNLVAVAT